MKNLETIVPSLETCKKLNWKGDTIFSWIKFKDWKIYQISFTPAKEYIADAKGNIEIIPAPTTTEIVNILPSSIIFKNIEHILTIHKDMNRYIAWYVFESCGLFGQKSDVSLIDAVSKLCILCKEEGYLK